MFKRFFESSKNPEKNEKLIQKVIEIELSIGVNEPALRNAFLMAQKKNKSENLGLTNNRILNMIRDIASGMSGSIEDAMYGGPERTFANINTEIEKMRRELSDGERGG